MAATPAMPGQGDGRSGTAPETRKTQSEDEVAEVSVLALSTRLMKSRTLPAMPPRFNGRLKSPEGESEFGWLQASSLLYASGISSGHSVAGVPELQNKSLK